MSLSGAWKQLRWRWDCRLGPEARKSAQLGN